MAFVVARAVERAGVFHCDFFARQHQDELAGIRRLRIKFERLVAHRHTRSAFQRVPVVVDHLLPRAAIDDSLIALDRMPNWLR